MYQLLSQLKIHNHSHVHLCILHMVHYMKNIMQVEKYPNILQDGIKINQELETYLLMSLIWLEIQERLKEILISLLIQSLLQIILDCSITSVNNVIHLILFILIWLHNQMLYHKDGLHNQKKALLLLLTLI